MEKQKKEKRRKLWDVVLKLSLIATIACAVFAALEYADKRDGGSTNVVSVGDGNENVTVVIGQQDDSVIECASDKTEEPNDVGVDELIRSVIGLHQDDAYKKLIGQGYTVGTTCSASNEPEDGKSYYVIDVFRSADDPNYLMMEVSKPKP